MELITKSAQWLTGYLFWVVHLLSTGLAGGCLLSIMFRSYVVYDLILWGVLSVASGLIVEFLEVNQPTLITIIRKILK